MNGFKFPYFIHCVLWYSSWPFCESRLSIYFLIATLFVIDVHYRVENDVKLLRNRVRMLQMEHEKAQKKIQETAKKTDELVNLRKRNDERFMRVSNVQIFV